jgi:hypothetical protein
MLARPRFASFVLFFVCLNALVWLAFGLIIAFNAHPALPDIPLLKGVMAALSLAMAGILLWVFTLLRKRSRIAYFATVGLFAVTCFLTIFDDFGLADFIVLVINLVPLGLLIKDRAWYLEKNL